MIKCAKCGEYEKLYPIFEDNDMIRVCWKCMQEYYKKKHKERMKGKSSKNVDS